MPGFIYFLPYTRLGIVLIVIGVCLGWFTSATFPASFLLTVGIIMVVADSICKNIASFV